MEPGSARGKVESPATERTSGWFQRLPVWARIVIPVVVLVIAAAIVVAVLQPRASADPVDAAESACRAAVQTELDSHDVDTRELSVFEVTTTEPDVYLVRGETAFSDSAGADSGDGEERRVRFRCTVRVEAGELQPPSVRFSEPIAVD
jgi:hypothetical protein